LDPLLFLTIVIVNFVMLAMSKEGVLLNIFAIAFNLIAFFECSSWFEFLFTSMFSILQSIIIVEKVGG
jgi:hypothetical protein